MKELKPCRYCGEEPLEEFIDWYDMDDNMARSSYRVRCPNLNCPIKPCAASINDQDKARSIWNYYMGA